MTDEKRRIHITGIGHAAQIPDTVVLSLTLTAHNSDYSAAMKVSAQQIEMLRESIVEAGFAGDDLKTTNFDVRTIYEDEEYREGNSKRNRQVFGGFECRHDLTLTFDMDNAKLNRALDTIASCLATPKISIAFTIKDTAALNAKLLKSAAKDAMRKAKILCAASGVKLGKLIDINYSRADNRDADTIVLGAYAPVDRNAFDIEPEEIIATESVNFLWEIE